MRTFEDTFAINETKVYPPGHYFKLITAVAGVDVEYFRNATAFEKAFDVTSGYGIRYDQPFSSVRVTSATAQTVKLGVSEGFGELDKTSTNITGGLIDTVSSITNIVAGTLTGIIDRKSSDALHFIDFIGVGAAAAAYSYLALRNPSGSGLTIALRRFEVMKTAAGTIALFSYAGDIGGASANTGANKQMGSLASTGELRRTTSGTLFGTQISLAFTLQANVARHLITHDPIIIPANQGVLIRTTDQNVDLEGQFEWEEY